MQPDRVDLSPDGQPSSLFILDDDPLCLQIVEYQLQCAGFAIVGMATSADKAMEQIGALEGIGLLPELLLCDICLVQECDGLEAARRIWERFRIPVVFMTAYTDVFEKASQLHPYGYLIKPCNEHQIRAVLEIAFRQKRARDALEQASRELMEKESRLCVALADAQRMLVDRVQAEMELRDAQQLLADLIQSIPNPVYWTNTESIIMGCNSAFCELAGIVKEKLNGCSITGMWSGAVTGLWSAVDTHLLYEGGIHVHECTLPRVDGSTGCFMHYKSAVGVTADKPGNGFIGVLLDITDRKTLEQESSLRLRALDVAVDGIVITTRDGIILYVNHAFETLTGYSASEALGKNPRVLKSGKMDVSFYNKMWTQLKNGQSWSGELINKRKDGTLYHEAMTIAPVTSAEGVITHYVAIKQDITQRKEFEHQHTQMEGQLLHAQKMESIGQLAAGIAHEINTPTQFVNDNVHFLQTSFQELRPVLEVMNELLSRPAGKPVSTSVVEGMLEAFKTVDGGYLMEEIPHAIEETLGGIQRVASIVKAMKEFSHPGVKEMTRVDLNHAILNTITVARNEWKYVAELTTDLDPNLPSVTCLLGEFNQVILNFIVNAAHAIEDKLGHNSDKKGLIHVQTRTDGGGVSIAISDNGTGIPEQHRSRIFDPFFTTKDVGRGTGQGLTIAHSVIVEKLGGSISFETQMGVGTTFHIHVPSTPQPKQKSALSTLSTP
ncbi:MAG: PAS domain S-box protein [Verrucomicrobiota bacterium]|nr:PAS domain S-box protein [Verrucomicrobiota bacterium]